MGTDDRQDSIGGLGVRWSDHLEPAALQLLRARNVAVVSTHAPGTRIRSRTVWVDTDGEHVLLNSIASRAWVRDLASQPAVNCTVVELTNPYEFASVEGEVVDMENAGADDHIDQMAQKYLGLDRYPFHDPATPRLLIRIRPLRVLHMAPESDELG